MRSTTSRKGQTSITHLMNFTLPPRPQYGHLLPQQRTGRRYPTWGVGSGHHAIDKAHFIHANYRFVVDPRGDYSEHALDADLHLDWSMVLQILASAQTQCSACPICLSTPVAPRMAKCGHIFCLPCLIQYMNTSDDSGPFPEKKPRWRKCPICWDSIYISETRPVRWFVGQEGPSPADGDDVVLRLVTRRPGNNLALPREEAESFVGGDDVPWHSAAEVMDYARIMRGSEEYMTQQFESEIEHIQQREREDELLYGDDPEWTRKAVSAVKEALGRIRDLGDPPKMQHSPVERKPPPRRPPLSSAPQEASDMSPTFTSKTPENASFDWGSSATLPAGHLRPGQEKTVAIKPRPMAPPADGAGPWNHDFAYHFYQALPHYYLSPLDIRILKAAFGDYASFPSTLLPRVDHVTNGHVVDEELRKRAKYLAHLPLGCHVSFLECEWTDIVAPQILGRFRSEVERRRTKNRDKHAREEKDRVRAERQEENQRWAAARQRRSGSSHEGPAGNGAAMESLDAAAFDGALDVGSLSASPPWPSSSRGQQGSAFAALASPSTSPLTHRTVWGTPAVASSSSPPGPPPAPARRSDEDDGWLQDWEQDLMREVDAVERLVSVAAAESLEPASQAPKAAPIKKKRGKKITLMSTTPRRGA